MARGTLKSVVGRIAMLALIGVAASPGLAQMRGGAMMGGGMPAMGRPAGGFGGGFGGFGGGFGGRGFGGMNMVRPTAFVGTTPVLPMKVYPYHVPEGGFVNHAAGVPFTTTRSGFVGSGGNGSVSSSGFGLNAAYSSSHWRLGIHVGSGFDGSLVGLNGGDHGSWGGWHGDHGDGHHGWWHKGRWCYPNVVTYPYWPWYGYGYNYGSYYPTLSGYYADPSLYSTPTPAAMTPAPAPVTENVTPSTQKDLGATYLSAGDAKAAVGALRTWVRDHPSDAEAMRLLGVALVESSQLPDGASMMSLAYHTSPGLAATAIPPEIFGTAARVREDVRKVSVYANRVRSASAWLTLAALMQAEGREPMARSMIEKAKAAGLETAVAEQFLSHLRS